MRKLLGAVLTEPGHICILSTTGADTFCTVRNDSKNNCPEQGRVAQSMNIKNKPNHRLYLRLLRQMQPEERLQKAFELSEFTRQLFIHGLRRRFPDLAEEEFRKLLLKRLDKCHNRNY